MSTAHCDPITRPDSLITSASNAGRRWAESIATPDELSNLLRYMAENGEEVFPATEPLDAVFALASVVGAAPDDFWQIAVTHEERMQVFNMTPGKQAQFVMEFVAGALAAK